MGSHATQQVANLSLPKLHAQVLFCLQDRHGQFPLLHMAETHNAGRNSSLSVHYTKKSYYIIKIYIGLCQNMFLFSPVTSTWNIFIFTEWLTNSILQWLRHLTIKMISILWTMLGNGCSMSTWKLRNNCKKS